MLDVTVFCGRYLMFQSSRFFLFSRQQSKKFVVVPTNNLLLDVEMQVFVQETGQPVITAHQVIAATPDKKYERSRCRDADGTSYVEFLSSTSGALYVEETPDRVEHAEHSTNEITFADYPSIAQLKAANPRFFEELTVCEFSFSVTLDMLNARMGASRDQSQNAVMGESARERLASVGARLPGAEGREAVHWAHRHGWALGGAQNATNLDLGTAGSNYSTLLWFEAPLKNLMRAEDITEVQAHGMCYMHPSNAIPIKIQYEFAWGNGRRLVGSTYPLETRLPTVAELCASYALFKHTRTPQHVTRECEADHSTLRQPDFSS